MMQIRPAQYDSLTSQQRRSFEIALIRHLRAHYPTYCRERSDQGLEEYIRDCERSAGRYGLRSEKAVVVWAELVIKFGPRFDWGVPSEAGLAEWPKYILNHDELSPEDKTLRLAGYVVKEIE